MIIVQIKGGLGNQLFQYCLGRYLSILKNLELKLDLSFYQDINHTDFMLTHSTFLLSHFNIKYSICQPQEKQLLIDKSNLLTSRIKRKINNLNTNVYIETDPRYNRNIYKLPKNVFLTGWFQSEKYFESVEETLRQELIFNFISSAENKKMAFEIERVNAISVHFRRGDYYKNEENKKYFGILPISYYDKCIDYITVRVPDSVFFVFSDDIDWAKENFKTKHTKVFVDINNEDTCIEDLKLISLCKHHIIANSSFSWWGAWLNNNPEKIVLAPSLWFGTDPQKTIDIVPDKWIKIENTK